MKSLVKLPIRILWRALGVVSRPIVGKAGALLTSRLRDPILAEMRALDGRFGSLERGVDQRLTALEHGNHAAQHGVELALSSCVREIARLEMQVEALREELEALAAEPGRLRALGVDDDAAGLGRAG